MMRVSVAPNVYGPPTYFAASMLMWSAASWPAVVLTTVPRTSA
jgi:hypothetical protein